MLVTVFTPTYNRAYIITQLYESLLRQSDTSFEWVVVDDGSTDHTEEFFEQILKENKIVISYIKTENGGKQRAINRGVAVAKGSLFFIVDSDDYLTDDAILNISKSWDSIKEKEKIAGLCFRIINYTTHKFIGGDCDVQEGEYTSIEIANKLQILGDKAEIFKTSIMKLFPFPEFENENFVPEALVWNRISKKYKLRFINKGIYFCEYLPDGLSYNFYKNLQKNPSGFALFYKEVLFCKGIPLLVKVKSLVRYLQCVFFSYKKQS
ncbi:glycosyltransferase family A protein [Flavobacterium sp. ARAG 55.4]|uniref:glycosyltransferase family A protein n=1 Tax=Flavobacterium sp. ARAG 55.4 TaxID=3451357 RepID=UPI003F4560E2